MNRRSFFRNFGGLIASAAIAQNVVGDWAKYVTNPGLTLKMINNAIVTLSKDVANNSELEGKYTLLSFGPLDEISVKPFKSIIYTRI